MNTTASVINNKLNTIDYRTIEVKTIKPIDYSNDPKTVDILLKECADLIDQRYIPWFAKRFYKLDKNSILEAASVARQDGKSSQNYFSHMIKQATK